MSTWDHHMTKIGRAHILNATTYQGHLGDNCIQNFHYGRYIVGYTVRNLVLLRRASKAIKRDFQMYIQQYTSQNENFEYGLIHSNAHLQFRLKLEHCKPHKAKRHPTKCDVIYNVIQSEIALQKHVY